MSTPPSAIVPDPPKDSSVSWLKSVAERAEHLKYGSILITIHENRVTQIDVLEKVRIPHGKAQRKEQPPEDVPG